MKQLLESIQKLKTHANIGNWFFDDEEICVGGQFRTGKVLTLYTCSATDPKEFPSTPIDRDLMREIGLNLQGWKMVDINIYSGRRTFKIYKLTQTERFLHHCENRTCINIVEGQGMLVLFFWRNRSRKEFTPFEQEVLIKLDGLPVGTEADYWDLGARIEYSPDVTFNTKGADPNAQPVSNVRIDFDKIPMISHRLTGVTIDCPDCKDGYYYPLIGEREPCRTCRQ